MESSSDLDSEQFENISYHQYSVIQKIKKAIHNEEFNFELDTNSTVNATDFTYTLLEVDCPDNTVPTNNQNNCGKLLTLDTIMNVLLKRMQFPLH